jgi:hypothetical protein
MGDDDEDDEAFPTTHKMDFPKYDGAGDPLSWTRWIFPSTMLSATHYHGLITVSTISASVECQNNTTSHMHHSTLLTMCNYGTTASS